jgi:uncharacterized DUF497 family protein
LTPASRAHTVDTIKVPRLKPAEWSLFGSDYERHRTELQLGLGEPGALGKAGIAPEEAEEVVVGEPLDIELQTVEESGGEERSPQVGETAKGRILQLLTTWRDGEVRVISAWDAPKQLKSYYLAEMRRRYGATGDSEV